MGNCIACVSKSNTKARIVSTNDMKTGNKVKVVFPNGTMEEFETPMLVADLMLENPLYFVCRSSPSNVARQAAALPAEATLELGQLYFLFPSYNVLQSTNQIRCQKFNTTQNILSQPLKSKEIMKEQIIGGEQANNIQNSDELPSPCGDCSGFINSQLQMAYERYQITRNKMWKPKLETIGETGRILIH